MAEGMREERAGIKGVERVEVAGSVRRCRATIGDFDFLVVADNPSKVMDFFVSMEGVDKIIVKGESKSTVRLAEGLDADLRVVPPESFGAALLYFTGSRDHNIVVRKVAIDRGYKLNEYGLFRGDRSVAGRTEEEIYLKLGMAFIPPELRENRGEVEAALEGRLPKLLEDCQVRGDLHTHTTWSDGRNSILEMAREAKAMGLEYMAVTDHAGSLPPGAALQPDDLKRQGKAIDKANAELDGFTILSGAEVNVMSDGSLDVPDSTLGRLDVVLAAVHSHFDLGPGKMADRLIAAISNDNVDIIAHPGRELDKRRTYEVQWDGVFEAARDAGVFLELNAHPARLEGADVLARSAIEAGCRLALGTDAHSKEGLHNLYLGTATARRGWAGAGDVVNTLPLKKLKKLF